MHRRFYTNSVNRDFVALLIGFFSAELEGEKEEEEEEKEKEEEEEEEKEEEE